MNDKYSILKKNQLKQLNQGRRNSLNARRAKSPSVHNKTFDAVTGGIKYF